MRTGRVKRVGSDGARTYEERFWLKVKKGKGDDCWIWKGALSKKGYGTIRAGDSGEVVYAHRYSFYIANGMDISDERYLLHSCDTPACVNPKHLREGSPLENVQDSRTRGRMAIGERDGNAKLNEKIVTDLINEWNNSDIRMMQLSKKYGFDYTTVVNIVKGISWKHVTNKTGITRKPFYGRPRK